MIVLQELATAQEFRIIPRELSADKHGNNKRINGRIYDLCHYTNY
jgi:hypothetical protein